MLHERTAKPKALPPAQDSTRWNLGEEKKTLADAFRFLEPHRFCDPATRLSARVYRLALEKAVSDAEERAQTDAKHSRAIFNEAVAFISQSIERELRELIQFELERDQFSKLRVRCERIAENAKPAWVGREARKLLGNFLDKQMEIAGKYDASKIAASTLPTEELLKTVKFSFSCLERFDELEWIADYDGPKFTDGAAKLKRAREITDFIASSNAPLKEKICALAEKLEVNEETVKKTLREVAYASFDGLEDVTTDEWAALGLSHDERFELDLRKTPHSMNDEIRKFHYAVRARQLNPDFCAKATLEYLSFPQESDFNDLVEAYAPLPEEEVRPHVERLLFYIAKTVKVKAESMDAHPVRAVSWFKQLKGRISKWEKEEIGKAPKEKLADLRRVQLEYDLLYVQAIHQFMRQVAELRGFINDYGSGLDPEFKRLVTELLGKDPMTDEEIVSDPRRLEQYFRSLEKTLDRWNELCKEFRKAPYNLERALKEKHGTGGGRPLSKVEIGLIKRIGAKKGDGFESELALLNAVREAKEEMVGRLESVALHAKVAKKIYHEAMEKRENLLGNVLPTKRQLTEEE